MSFLLIQSFAGNKAAKLAFRRETMQADKAIRDICPRHLCAAATRVAVHDDVGFEDAIERFYQHKATFYNVASSLLNRDLCNLCRGH